MPYPRELRQRVIDKHAQGDAQAEIAETLEVSVGWVNKIIQCFAAHGRLFPPRKKTGPKPKLGEHHRALIQEWLSGQPELTLAQLAEKMEDRIGVPVNQTNIHDALKAMGYTHKKKRSFPTSSAGPT